MINLLYAQHASGVLALDEAIQGLLANMRQQLELLSDSLSKSAGNGRHKISSSEVVPMKSLHGVLALLLEDIRRTPWM